jgi:hypothetical protein
MSRFEINVPSKSLKARKFESFCKERMIALDVSASWASRRAFVNDMQLLVLDVVLRVAVALCGSRNVTNKSNEDRFEG